LAFTPPGPGQPTGVRIPGRAQFAGQPAPGSTDPPPTFEYLGPDLDIDLAGPAVSTRADGKLAYAGLPVRHRQAVAGEVLGSSTGEADQELPLAGHPVVLDTLVVTVDEGAGPVAWTRQDNLAYHIGADGLVELSTADSRDYMVRLDEAGAVSVVFGDGE